MSPFSVFLILCNTSLFPACNTVTKNRKSNEFKNLLFILLKIKMFILSKSTIKELFSTIIEFTTFLHLTNPFLFCLQIFYITIINIYLIRT